MNMTLFFGAFVALLFSLHMLFYLRVVRRLLFSSALKRGFASLLGLNFLLNISYMLARFTNTIETHFYYLFSLSLGLSFVLLLYLILHESIELFHKSIRKVDSSKREFLKKGGDGILMGLSTVYLSAGIYEGGKAPIIQRVELGLFDFSIVQISDFHIGGLVDQRFVKQAVEQINSLQPGIVVITGDLIDTNISLIRDAILELNQIRSEYGVFMILGNHEYFHSPLEIVEFIQNELQATLLLNESTILDTLKVNIVGVTDLFGYRADLLPPDINKAYEKINPHYPSILLAHQPKFIEELGDHRPELILSGHTHGGQIWPFNHLVGLQQPYIKGLHTLPYGGKIYINSGIGFWGPPMRLGSQAEITYFT